MEQPPAARQLLRMAPRNSACAVSRDDAIHLAALEGFPDRVAKRRGDDVLLASGGAAQLTLDPDAISLGSLRVQGVFGASRAAWRWLLELYGAGLFVPDALITHRFGLDQVIDAFTVLANVDAGALKVVVESGTTAEEAILYSNSTRSTLTQV